MVWINELRGLKVISGTKCIGRVVQASMSDSLCALDGIWIDRAFFGLRFISAEHICIIGRNSVIVDHKGDRLRMKPSPIMIRAVTTEGVRLGAITDAAIDEQTFTTSMLALTKSWPERLVGRMAYVTAFKYDPSANRVIVLPAYDETEVKIR